MSLIKVLIADDSAFLRKSIASILSEEKSIEIVDMAINGREAIEKVNKHHPDVLILDLLMPEMDGLEAFKHIMKDYPVPTIILSAVNPQNMDTSVQALLMGAFDYVIKPGGIGAKDLPRFREELRSKVLLASQSQITRIYARKKERTRKTTLRQQLIDDTFEFGVYLRDLKPIEEEERKIIEDASEKSKLKLWKKEKEKDKLEPKLTEEISPPLKKEARMQKIPSISSSVENLQISRLTNPIIVIGASVGGPKTVRTILKDMPRSLPVPILVVQHLSEFFLESFAMSLDAACKIKVKVAQNGEQILPGIAYISPGGKHMEITMKGNEPIIKIFEGEPVNFCIPSVDVLFFSAAKFFKRNTIGILLTGMGKDGVDGLGVIKNNGGITIAESEETSVLYGMPKFAKEQGVAKLVLPNYKISEYIQSLL
ncbi:MAG: chemotaxis-specific protein-glutamate methyltransferase CheB [Candidatus Lokiarchaeota archaeon]|nr:chemotaxis-specific protein-glutamate methyltransferase CheB [Candidatus Lokiarchaeota archaeon]